MLLFCDALIKASRMISAKSVEQVKPILYFCTVILNWWRGKNKNMNTLNTKRFIEVAWSLPSGNYVFEQNSKNLVLINQILRHARAKQISCFKLDFGQHTSSKEAFLSPDGQELAKAIGESLKSSIVYFEHADPLAANDEVTYWLRTCLEQEQYTKGNIVPLFSMQQASIKATFLDAQAPFYQSHYMMCVD